MFCLKTLHASTSELPEASSSSSRALRINLIPSWTSVRISMSHFGARVDSRRTTTPIRSVADFNNVQNSARLLESTTPKIQTNMNAETSIICDMTDPNKAYFILALRSAPTFENTGAVNIVGNNTYVSESPPRKLFTVFPFSGANESALRSSSLNKSRLRKDLITAFQARANSLHCSEAASAHKCVEGDDAGIGLSC